MKGLLYRDTIGTAGSIGLLALRVVAGIAFMFHGWMKVQNPTGWMGEDAPFPAFLLVLATISEFGGGLAWILGLLTPLASFGILCTMTVAASTHIMRGDPFVGSGGSFELPLVYLSVALLLLLAGPGRYSLDRTIFGPKRVTARATTPA